VPSVGAKDGVEYNYEVMHWYLKHWDDEDSSGHSIRNVHATAIGMCLYVALAFLWAFKKLYNPSAEVKKSLCFRAYTMISTLAVLIAIVIAAAVAKDLIQNNDSYAAQHLKIVGDVPPGLDFFRMPKMRQPWGPLFLNVIPMTIISYMESFSVARKIAGGHALLRAVMIPCV
jgi:hypothetical protein